MKTLAPVVVATVKPRSADKATGERPPTPTPGPLGPQAHLKLSARQRQALLEQFATLVDSGIQVAQALTAMRQQGVDPQQEPVLRSLEQAVTAGLPLSQAMAALPRAFPPLLVQMVRAGEATGQLGDMLLRTVESLEADAALRARLRSALIYPAVMLVLTIGVVVFLLTYIVPKFERMLRGKVLPAPTQVLLALGDFLQAHGVWLGLGVVTALVGTVLALRTPAGRRWLDQVLLRLPVLGPLVRTAALARSTRTFGLLLQAGVPVHAALEHTQAVAGNEAYRALWLRAQRQVTNGGSLLDAVRGQPLLGPNFEQLVAAGESTATLDRVLLKVGTQTTKDLERRVRDLVTLLEPVMVVVMASVVGFVALSIMLPIFQMSRH